MRPILSFCFLLFAFIGVFAQVRETTYRNSKYAFSVNYPQNLFRTQVSEIGITLTTLNGDVKIEVFASENINNLDLAKYAHVSKYVSGASWLTTNLISSNEFILSGKIRRRYYFQRTVHQKLPESDIYYNLIAKYPSSARKKWGAIVKEISKSLKIHAETNVRH
jgi:predicted component of type VI protein secretion system